MNTSVNVLMINAQGIMLSVFIKYPSIVLIVDMLGYFF